MSIIQKAKSVPKLDADEALNRAVEWVEHLPPNAVDGQVWALISIAASLRELAAKR